MSWWNLLAAPIAGVLALAYGRRLSFWILFALCFGFWSLLIDIAEAMDLAGRNLVAASAAQDPELMEAVLVNVLHSLPSYLTALRGE